MGDYAGVAIIILAAGKGTRMKSDLAKVLHKVDRKSMVNHVIECARKVSREHIHVVVGHQEDKVRKEVTDLFDVHFSRQEHLLGTGDAVKSALPDIDPRVKDVMVLCGDVPLIRKQTLEDLVKGHRADKAAVTVLATTVDNPTGYGRLILDRDGKLQSIKEEADANDTQKAIKIINTGIYCFDRQLLSLAIASLKPDNSQEEYYLTDVIKIAQEKKYKISVVTMDDPRQVIGVNTPEDLTVAEHLIHQLDG